MVPVITVHIQFRGATSHDIAILLYSIGCGLMIPSTPLRFYLNIIQLSGRVSVWEEVMCFRVLKQYKHPFPKVGMHPLIHCIYILLAH